MLFRKLREREDKIIDSANTYREIKLKRQMHYLIGFSNAIKNI